MKRRGFTLIELLLVVVIIAIVYTIAFNTNITKIIEQEDDSVITLDNIYPMMSKYKQNASKADLICSNDNMECFLFVDGNFTEKRYELSQTLRDHYMTKDDEVLLKDYAPIRIEEDEIFPTFIYSIFSNNTASDNLIELDDGSFAYLDPYLNEPKIFSNSVDALSFIHKHEYMPQQAGLAHEK